MATVEKPLRRDAERNRQRILEAARELFAERGLAVTLDDVADRAGLGVGTVYRRFSSRDELVEALFEEKMWALIQVADEALEVEDPWLALSGFIERLVAMQSADRGLKEVMLGTSEGRERVTRVREQLRPRADELVRRAQAAGLLRSDFCASDLPLIQMMVGSVAELTADERPDLWRRFLQFVLDGMRPGAKHEAPLPASPLGFDALEGVMCRWRPAVSVRRPRA